ncbi:alpha/beta hydrolase [Sphingomonas sp. ID0503]|uniref:alpha/beta hydrolase n=1 Tax=Sphingomonas sp. ID0503 TaxID=3399691 RepID=UPI003AFA101C
MVQHETAAKPERMARILEGLRAYQEAPRINRVEKPPVVARAGRAMLRSYGDEGRPLIVVPSLINPPDVLDLSEANSLLRWLATQGVRPFLVDWGEPDGADRDMTVAGHVEALLTPLLADFGPETILAGYCIGGTMAMALAQTRPFAGLGLIATPWVFSGFPDSARATMAGLWGQTHLIAERLGYLPMEVLQTAFWQLDPARTVAKFERFAGLEPGSAKAQEFVAMEDWANAGAPLTYGAAREMLEDMFGQDLPGTGRWMVAGEAVDPARIACPVFNIVSRGDRIVPAESAAPVGERLDLDLGHVGMIVGGRAREAMWEPLASWLRALG